MFVLPYSMVAEAAAGVKILASHQDVQWTAVKEGLENCQTRDGQNSPSADISWAGNKITNLDTPTSGTDAANKTYVDSRINVPWITEANAVIRITNNSLRVVGGNYTATYTIGRRVKITHNAGATVSYATVFASIFPGTGGFTSDTVLGLAIDGGVALVAPITVLEYAQLEYLNPSYLDPRSVVLAFTSATATYGAAPSLTKITFDSKSWDTNSEYSLVTYRFVTRYPGYYTVGANLNLVATSGGNARIHIYRNGTTEVNFPFILTASTFGQTKQASIPMLLDYDDNLEIYFESTVNCDIVGDASKPFSNFSVVRIP